MPLPGTGPSQPLISSEETKFPSTSYAFKVPQKAKEVLVDFVLLSMDTANVGFNCVSPVQVKHGCKLVNSAPTTLRSFEVQLVVKSLLWANRRSLPKQITRSSDKNEIVVFQIISIMFRIINPCCYIDLTRYGL